MLFRSRQQRTEKASNCEHGLGRVCVGSRDVDNRVEGFDFSDHASRCVAPIEAKI